MRNNGNIEIIPSAEDMADASIAAGSAHEVVWINAVKYMIPERTIRLDFLDKVAESREVHIEVRKPSESTSASR